ncbi:5'-3' exonuclease PLD3-like [Manacus candei]|uniref:5'-3' exonuclease PLD3-like n=1 Tax=Manacus candei TaxID=415023 RepID=UPI002227FF26|nr:5'-3' exonuclease PLD3-like [Manacus candei]
MKALSTGEKKVSERQSCRRMEGLPSSLGIIREERQPFGLLGQFTGDKKDFCLWEWIFLPHQFGKTITTVSEMIGHTPLYQVLWRRETSLPTIWQIMYRDPLTETWTGPFPLITWGKGYACISGPDGPKWVTSELCRNHDVSTSLFGVVILGLIPLCGMIPLREWMSQPGENLWVKEVSAAVYNCTCLAQDLAKIFEAYWALGVLGASIPSPWPENFSTSFNLKMPLVLTLSGTDTAVYFSSSPPPLCAEGRTADLDALLDVINGAAAFVDVAVMTYLPGTEFSRPERFWPPIDEQLRRAMVERGVAVRLLVGCWEHSNHQMFPFLHSLAALANGGTGFDVQVRLFLVPEDPRQSRIPFTRVNHNKYMVTDKVAYVGTSNWSGDYFERTGGLGLVVAQPGGGSGTFREKLRALFQRDWESQYSVDIRDPQRWGSHCGTE